MITSCPVVHGGLSVDAIAVLPACRPATATRRADAFELVPAATLFYEPGGPWRSCLDGSGAIGGLAVRLLQWATPELSACDPTQQDPTEQVPCPAWSAGRLNPVAPGHQYPAGPQGSGDAGRSWPSTQRGAPVRIHHAAAKQSKGPHAAGMARCRPALTPCARAVVGLLARHPVTPAAGQRDAT